jgi:rRNA maturation RNase YbeY
MLFAENMPTDKITVDVVFAPNVPLGPGTNSELLIQAISQTLQKHDAVGKVDLLLTDDADIQQLNLRFRHIDSPTDVLTFPAYHGDLPESADEPLGDIAISIPYAQRQAEARGVSLSNELAMLAIHGALHLVGYDDIEDADRRMMQEEMNTMAIALGLEPDPEWSSVLHASEGESTREEDSAG